MALNSLQAYSDDFAALAERMIRSTVRVIVHNRGAGSGIVWSADGVVLTAEHVIRNERGIEVRLDGKTYEAKLVGRDPATDLALLRVEATKLAAAEIADSKKLKVGSRAFAVGRPWSDEPIVRAGIVSAIGRLGTQAPMGHLREGVIHTDIILYPGFSGGPLADASGRVVGINTMVVGGDMALAIPTQTISRVVTQLLQSGDVKRGYLGVAVQMIPLAEPLARKLGLEQETGLMILTTENGHSGLMPGDILVGLDGTRLARMRELQGWLATVDHQQEVKARVIRGGELHEFPVAVDVR